jgi:RNA polymerase sigma factor (TIGR02999 family)
MAEITDLLARARGGDATAVAALTPLVYQRLRELAHRQLGREAAPHTLDTTALVHEVYVDLLQREQLPAPDRARFFAYAATAMRHILVDEARRRIADKRGAGCEHTGLDRLDGEAAAFALDSEAQSVVAIDQALGALMQQSPRLVQIIEMRFFAGLSVEETAAALDLDPRSVVRDWQKARLFLHEALGS